MSFSGEFSWMIISGDVLSFDAGNSYLLPEWVKLNKVRNR